MFSKAKHLFVLLLFLSSLLLVNCKKESKEETEPPYQDEPYVFKLNGLRRFGLPPANPNNPITVNGVALGRKLFYDPILSGDKTQSCASCHNQATSFSDAPNRFSKGIDGIEGDKNSMAIINLAWNKDFFWDGRSSSLEEQALEPVPNPIEMHLEWNEAVKRLQATQEYPDMFRKAFGADQVDSLLVARALSQFMKTIVAVNTKYHGGGSLGSLLNVQELSGLRVFRREDEGDCFHCHTLGNNLFTSNSFDDPVQRFHNNGLDPEAPAGVLTGRARVTKNRGDNGKFKAPTLINIDLTPPYMHDGRFKTLEEVIAFYDTGVHFSSTLDPNMNIKVGTGQRKFVDGKRKLGLSQQQKDDLLAFLKALTDISVTTNPEYSKP